MPNRIASDDSSQDPLVVHSLREARWIVGIWLLCFLWVIGYCSQFGYGDDGKAVATIYGMPSWVFWGVALPWIFATFASAWFALVRIADDPLTGGESATGDNPPSSEAASIDSQERQSNDG